MTSISATGSGLDIVSLVESLVEAARAPAEERITTANTTATAKLSAISQIKSGMTTLQSALEKLTSSADGASYTATVASGAGFTATTSSDAVAGDYSVEVVSLATAQKLSSAAYASDASASGSGGTLTIAYGDESIEVAVGADATLADIAKAVNKAAGGKGVVASVVTDDDGQHLVFTAAGTGTENALTISASGDDALQSLTNGDGGGLTETVAATDAVVKVDGFTRTSSSNTVTDLVPGVTLTLTKAAEGTTYNLKVASDNSTLKSNISSFVTAYNSVMSTLKSVSSYDSTTQTASALTGDSLVRTLQQQLRSQISSNTTDLKALGITVDKDGVMSFDSTTFDSAIAADPEAASKLFGSDGKVGSAMSKVIDGQLDTYTGTLVLRSNSINKQIESLEDQLTKLDERMTKLSDLYTKQFTAMETMITTLQSSASSLNDLLAD